MPGAVVCCRSSKHGGAPSGRLRLVLRAYLSFADKLLSSPPTHELPVRTNVLCRHNTYAETGSLSAEFPASGWKSIVVNWTCATGLSAGNRKVGRLARKGPDRGPGGFEAGASADPSVDPRPNVRRSSGSASGESHTCPKGVFFTLSTQSSRPVPDSQRDGPIAGIRQRHRQGGATD
jgi:hypothetical protein